MKKGKIYLVVDPSMELERLCDKLTQALTTGEICAVQLWDHWPVGGDVGVIIHRVAGLCRGFNVPVLVNQDWTLVERFELDGVHFDELPAGGVEQLKTRFERKILVGMTVGNDLSRLLLPEAAGLDYISFCSVFPSRSAGACEIVRPDTIQRAREITNLPVFLSGGINLSTLPQLSELPFDGLAIISGVMGVERPGEAVSELVEAIKIIKKNDFQ